MSDSYYSISLIASDGPMTQRVTACAATEGDNDPAYWAAKNAWKWASQPGWGAAWDSALAADNPNPGADSSVITDGMILSAVQAIKGQGDD